MTLSLLRACAASERAIFFFVRDDELSLSGLRLHQRRPRHRAGDIPAAPLSSAFGRALDDAIHDRRCGRVRGCGSSDLASGEAV
jgi:hypothetical protein